MFRSALSPVRVALAGVALLAALAIAGAGSPPVTASGSPDLLDVVRVGTGSAALTSAATATFVVPLLSTGTVGTPIALPTADSGSQHALTSSGTASSEAALALSQNGSYLTLGGYDAVPGTTGPSAGSINTTTSASTPRVIARIDGAGNVDTSTALTDAFSASNFRGVVSSDGTHFWAAGDGGSVASGSDKNAGVVYVGSLGATTSTGLTTAPKQARVPVIANGNLYFSTSKSPGPGVFQLGSGLPTTSGQTTTSLAAEADPYGIVLLKLNPSATAPDTLYAADGTTGGIAKYSFNGSSWASEGVAGAGTPLASLTGAVENGNAQLYATTADGTKVVSFTDSSGAGATISSGAFATITTAPANTVYRGISFAPSGQASPTPSPTITLSDTALSATIGDSFEPTLSATVADGTSYTPDQLTVTATSSNQAVAADSGIAVSGNGTTGPRTLTLTPAGTVGYSTITVTATTPDGVSGTTTFLYGVSAAAPDATSSYLYGSGSDASTAVDVGDGYFIVGDDEYDVLAMYKSGGSGEPVKTWDFRPQMGNPGEIDIEAAARLGDTIYWTGSMSNSSSGKLEPDRSLLFATKVTDSGASTDLSFVGYYSNLRSDLISWDESNGNQFGFAADAASGQIAKQVNGFNVEGMEFAAGGSGTAYLGFRAPIVPPGSPADALVVPVTNLTSLVTGAATRATFGTPIEWDLTPTGYANGNGDASVLGIREIRKNADDQYLILAGSYEGVPAAPTGGSQFLYTWDGDPADAPVLTNTVLPTPDGGSWESIVSVPDPLADGDPIPLIEDDGGSNPYGDPPGTELKDLAFGLQKDHADSLDIALPGQTVTFTSSPPSPAVAGSTYPLTATGGASGNPIVFGIDASSDAGVCSVSNDLVQFIAPGNCVIDASQDGTFQYAAGAATPQAVTIDAASPTLSTQASGGVAVGGSVSDTATLSGGSSPAGTITFSLYGPTDATCASTPVFTATATASGDGQYVSGSYAPVSVGTYRWIATYSGDPANNGAAGACGDAGESVVVGKAAPTLGTNASAGVQVSGSVSDTATVSGGSNPSGSITFSLYGPNDSTCSTTPAFTSTVAVTGDGNYGSGPFVPASAGTYRWIASYGGDSVNGAAAGACGDAGESVVVAALPTPANLGITLKEAPSPGTIGGPLTYTLTVKNGGPGSATGVTVGDAVPATTTYISAVASQGGCGESAGTVTCALGTLANGASATVTITVTATAAGSVVDTATVAADETDSHPANNTAAITTKIVGPDLSITVKSAPSPGTVNGPLTYTLTVKNGGPGSATGVTVGDAVPATTTYISAVASQGGCGESAGTVTCALGTLANGASATVTITVTATAAGSVVDTATVAADETDSHPANNTATVTTRIVGPNLTITKTGSPNPVHVGGTLTYTITVKDKGPGGASGVTVTDPLPAGVTYVSSTTTAGSCTQTAGTVACALGAIANGGSATITIKVTPTKIGRLVNTATLTANETDPHAGNTATAQTVVNP